MGARSELQNKVIDREVFNFALLTSIMSTNHEILLYNKVQIDDGTQGVVRYIGNIMGKKGVFHGIDVTKGDSKNDGKYKGIKYFDTKRGHS